MIITSKKGTSVLGLDETKRMLNDSLKMGFRLLMAFVCYL